jgi:hypothetical protein
LGVQEKSMELQVIPKMNICLYLYIIDIPPVL